MSKSRILSRFQGKACSIYTNTLNRQLTPEEAFMYMVGVVEEIDELGILITQVKTGQQSFFYHNQIVFIAEEIVEVLDQEKDAELIDKIQNAAGIKSKYDPKQDNEYIDIDEMTNLVENQAK